MQAEKNLPHNPDGEQTLSELLSQPGPEVIHSMTEDAGAEVVTDYQDNLKPRHSPLNILNTLKQALLGLPLMTKLRGWHPTSGFSVEQSAQNQSAQTKENTRLEAREQAEEELYQMAELMRQIMATKVRSGFTNNAEYRKWQSWQLENGVDLLILQKRSDVTDLKNYLELKLDSNHFTFRYVSAETNEIVKHEVSWSAADENGEAKYSFKSNPNDLSSLIGTRAILQSILESL